MELSIKNSDFLPVLQKCSKALETKATIPILSTFHLNAEHGRLIVSATDLAIAVTSSAPCAIGKEGKICLNGDKLLHIVQALRSEESSALSVAKSALTIKSGKSRFKIAGVDAGTFPDIPEAPETCAIFDAPLFRRSVERVKFAISKEDSRFVLLAMLLECTAEKLTFAATDGHRMAVVQIGPGDTKPFKVLIPLAGLQALPSVLASMDHIEISIADNRLWFQQGYDTLQMQRVTGSFPDYERTLPKESTLSNVATLKVEDFKEGILRSLLCAAQGKDTIPSLDIDFLAEEMSLFGADAVNANEAQEGVSVKYDGPNVSARFNGNYLTECLSAIGTSEVSVRFKDEKGAFELRPLPEDGYRYVVMPLRK